MSCQNLYKWMGEASENIIIGIMLSIIIPVALVIWFVNVIFYTSYSHEGKFCNYQPASQFEVYSLFM